MALTRTRTMGLQDVALCERVESVTVATTRSVVAPFNGVVERILVARAATHSASETYLLTIGSNALVVRSGASGGAAGDVDAFEFARNHEVAKGESVLIQNNGVPAGANPVSYTVVVRRL